MALSKMKIPVVVMDNVVSDSSEYKDKYSWIRIIHVSASLYKPIITNLHWDIFLYNFVKTEIEWQLPEFLFIKKYLLICFNLNKYLSHSKQWIMF